MTHSAESADGVLLLDKPPGLTSAKAVAAVKNVFQARKTGHAGTLDPFATGILICCINRATKLARFFINADKKYVGVLRLGIETDTQDATGNIVNVNTPVSFSRDRIAAAFRQFQGRYLQSPPVYSALKHRGRPLYQYARRGEPIRKPPRAVDIRALDILAFDPPFVQFEVVCSAGTYIRSLCADIGQRIGCGGHLVELRRVASGRFTLHDAVDLAQLKELARNGAHRDRLIPMADTLYDMPPVTANYALTEHIKHGRMIRQSDLFDATDPRPEELVKVLDPHHQLIAVMRRVDQKDQLKYECVFN